MKITSSSNLIIKDLLKLYKRSFRDATKLFILEGRREVERLNKNFNIKKVFVTNDDKFDATTYRVTPNIFEKISMRGQKEGIVIVAEQKHHSMDSFFKALPKNPNILVLDGLQKPGNVGAILRSASAFGIDGVILSDCPIDLYNPNLLRAAICSIQSVPILTSSAALVIEQLEKRGVAIYTSALEKSQCLSEVEFSESFALVLGSEDCGARKSYLDASVQKIKISMNQDAVDSLNVSVAAACFCYEIRRRKAIRNLL